MNEPRYFFKIMPVGNELVEVVMRATDDPVADRERLIQHAKGRGWRNILIERMEATSLLDGDGNTVFREDRRIASEWLTIEQGDRRYMNKTERIERVKREVLNALPDPPRKFDGAYAMAVAADLYPDDTWERGFAPMFVLRAWTTNFCWTDTPPMEAS